MQAYAARVTPEEVGSYAESLPQVKRKGTESRPAWYVNDRLVVRLQDPGTLVIRVPLSKREALLDAFPDCVPYGGKHRNNTPHLSVGSRLPRSIADALAAEVVPLLPLSDRIDALSLMFETGDGWRHERSWPFTGR